MSGITTLREHRKKEASPCRAATTRLPLEARLMGSSRHPFERRPRASVLDHGRLLASLRHQWRRLTPLAPAEPQGASAAGLVSANDVTPSPVPGRDLGFLCDYANAKYGEGMSLPWSADGEAAAAAALGSLGDFGDSIAELWLAEVGPVAALAALVAERSLAGARADAVTTLTSQGPESSYIGRGIPGKWGALRAYLCAAPPPEYEATLEFARELQSSAGLSLRCALSYLFPQKPEWARDAALTALKPPPPVPSSATLLFASLDDVELMLALIGAANRQKWGGLSAEDLDRALVDGRIATGLERLERRRDDVVDALDDVRRLSHEALAGLFEVAPQSVTRVFVRLVGDANLDDAARAFLAAHPAEAMGALAGAMAKGKRRAVLGPVLAVLVATNRSRALRLAQNTPAPVTRVLVAAGATEEIVSRSAAKKLGAAFAATRVPALSKWLENAGSVDELRAILRSAAADDASCPARLAGLAKAIASEPHALALAMTVIDTLAEVGTDACVLALALHDAKVSSADVAARARDRLHSVLGLGDEDLEDLVVPHRAATAREREAQGRRLEIAMVEGRRWPPLRFARTIVPHPLLGMLARGLVWGAFAETGVLLCLFCIDDQCRLRGEDGNMLDLAAAAGVASVGVAHLAELSHGQLAWARRQRLSGPPFEQLERGRAVEPGSDGTFEVTRPLRKVLSALVSCGWACHQASAGDGLVDYYRVIRGCEVGLTVVREGPSLSVQTAVVGTDTPESNWKIAVREAHLEVTRACAGTPM